MKMENLIGIGILIIVIGFIIIFVGALGSKDSNTKVAIGGFIGPIPFGFGNDKKLLLVITLISITLLAVWVLFNFRVR